jgi:hypothetical protein
VSAKAESQQVNVVDGRPFINEEIHQTSSCFADVTCVSGSRVVERSAGQFTPINSDDVIVANWQVGCQQGPIKFKKKENESLSIRNVALGSQDKRCDTRRWIEK